MPTNPHSRASWLTCLAEATFSVQTEEDSVAAGRLQVRSSFVCGGGHLSQSREPVKR